MSLIIATTGIGGEVAEALGMVRTSGEAIIAAGGGILVALAIVGGLWIMGKRWAGRAASGGEGASEYFDGDIDKAIDEHNADPSNYFHEDDKEDMEYLDWLERNNRRDD